MGSPRGKNRKAAPSKPVTTEAPASNSGPAYINPQLWPLCRPIAWFKPDPENARLHPPENLAATAASLRRFKQQKNVVALEDGTVVAGNGTLEAAKGLGWEQLAAVTFASLDEAVAYAVADNRSAELAVWGPKLQASMDRIAALKIDLADVGFVDADALRKIVVQAHERAAVGESDNAEGKYTSKIISPVYTPKDEKPPVSTLVDTAKTDALTSEIDMANIPVEVAAFLRHAAQRHTVFNFRKIADFYAHSDASVQNLFEKSALVIIDFNKAIENGFVRLTDRIEDLIKQEQENKEDDSDAQ